MDCRTTRLQPFALTALVALSITAAVPVAAQTPDGPMQNPPSPDPPAQSGVDPAPSSLEWQYGAFIDVGRLFSSTSPSNHLFRNRGTTPRLDTWDLNMTVA